MPRITLGIIVAFGLMGLIVGGITILNRIEVFIPYFVTSIVLTYPVYNLIKTKLSDKSAEPKEKESLLKILTKPLNFVITITGLIILNQVISSEIIIKSIVFALAAYTVVTVIPLSAKFLWNKIADVELSMPKVKVPKVSMPVSNQNLAFGAKKKKENEGNK